ncbi:hypothetical protein FE257_004111 [Aspergillus nanangensis]|uniref:BTB domain-containing protein n=1 Tax=Aspergillus nanangensis TaxID=2582783 RepID=A0AAD4GN44_ASPNN|nr:hypothetical protein FE257_004111 [Aspergillus nanangensis]
MSRSPAEENGWSLGEQNPESLDEPHNAHHEIIIAQDSDRIIKVREYDRSHGSDSEEKDLQMIGTASMHVSSKALEHIDYFKSMLRGSWRESSQEIILEDDKITAVEVWMRLFHSTLDKLDMDSISIEDVWYLIITGDKYGLNFRKLSSWFAKWYGHQDSTKTQNFERKMLYPCYVFNYARGFLAVSKHLVYNVAGHISEVNPTEITQLHIAPRVLQQLNAARGRLRNLINRYLNEKVKCIVGSSSCECKENTVFYYYRELRRIQIWPLEEITAKTSVDRLLTRLKDFDEQLMLRNMSKAKGPEKLCSECTHNWKRDVQEAIKKVSTYFDGLCLDCMVKIKDEIKIIRHSSDDEYYVFTHNRYDEGCRVDHGEPTQYFSVNGRRDKRGLIAD